MELMNTTPDPTLISSHAFRVASFITGSDVNAGSALISAFLDLSSDSFSGGAVHWIIRFGFMVPLYHTSCGFALRMSFFFCP